MRTIIAFLAFSFLVFYNGYSQCILSVEEAEKIISTEESSNIIGKWDVSLRGTLFYNNAVLQSDYIEYEIQWYIIPEQNGYRICSTNQEGNDVVANSYFIRDDVIPDQFFYYADHGYGKVLSLARLITPDILSFHYKVDDEFVKNNYGETIKNNAIEEVSLLWEYVLTRAN